MKSTVITRIGEHPAGKIRLAGTVSGIDACEMIADCDTLVVGSALDCDLVVPDPLIPPRAFKLIREKCHYDTTKACRCFWTLDTFPQARVYVNDQFTRKEKLALGDTISVGCHQFVFSGVDTTPRNRRSNINVQDVCARLLTESPIPPGFLSNTPLRRYLVRRRKALTWVGLLVLLTVAMLVLTPREQFFEPIQEPLEVVMIAERAVMPAPDAVRSLEATKRQAVETPNVLNKTADLTPQKPVLVEDLPVTPPSPIEVAKPPTPAPTELGKIVTDTGPLKPVVLAAMERTKAEMPHDIAKLGESAPLRRLTVAEAAQAREQGALSRFKVALDEKLWRSVSARPVVQDLTGNLQKPSRESLVADRAKRLEQLAAYKPSPVSFEDYQGLQIPVVRITEQLEELKTISVGHENKVDGVITEAEMAANWKSDRFLAHAPGKPPPAGNPATYCYVGKADYQGKPALYVSFVCMDSDVSRLIITADEAVHHDDSVEIYLDINYDHHDYHQLIVNAAGRYLAGYHPAPHGPGHPSTRWNVTPVIKTTINKQAGQWVCEVLIPFDQLGGVPAKGTRWAVNFCRNYRSNFTDPRGDHPNAQRQSWFDVYEKRVEFHMPHLFGVFQW